MAKKNNKGFSLIEIVVAIAILTLLVTPIINQLAQTVKVNRRSKLQQYVNDNASKFMEDVKSKTATELDASYSKTRKNASGNTQASSASKRNRFNNFEQRDYDFDELEKMLLTTSVQ